MCKELDTNLNFITLDFEDVDLENDELEGYIYEYTDVNDEEFELIDIESDEEFDRIAGKIEAFEAAREE